MLDPTSNFSNPPNPTPSTSTSSKKWPDFTPRILETSPDDAEVPPFIPGSFFNGVRDWNEVVSGLEERGFEVPDFFKLAAREKAFRPLHRSYTNPTARNIRFRGKKFDSIEQLKQAPFQNTIELSKQSLDSEMNKLLSNGTIKIVDRNSHFADGGWINPILFIYSNKPRIVLHSRLNYQYTKPVLSMTDIHSQAPRLIQENCLYKCDLTNAFFQFPLHEDEKRYFRFELGGSIYEFQPMHAQKI